jgi:hypothetical protein
MNLNKFCMKPLQSNKDNISYKLEEYMPKGIIAYYPLVSSLNVGVLSKNRLTRFFLFLSFLKKSYYIPIKATSFTSFRLGYLIFRPLKAVFEDVNLGEKYSAKPRKNLKFERKIGVFGILAFFIKTPQKPP